MIIFSPGRQLAKGDLNLIVRDEHGILYDPHQIQYTIFQLVDGAQTLALGPRLTPEKSAVGLYWINATIPTGWDGTYQLVWYMTKNSGDPDVTVYEEFTVATMDISRSSHEAPSLALAQRPGLTPQIAEMIALVRELLSDENPDRNYHFRPPTQGKTVAGFSQRVGFIWTDETIIRMIKLAIAQLNTFNPLVNYGYTIETIPADWSQAAAVGAAAHCLTKEAARWAADEFSYSLNGVSLDINKAQTYQSMGESLKAEFKEWATAVSATKPRSVGLRQSRWIL